MKKLTEIIVATGNAGKMDEIREIMRGFPVEIRSMKEAGVYVDAEENGSSFEENALIKAKAVAEAVGPREGTMVLADDSGLVVDALNGEPGIYSARYLGRDTSYAEKNADIIRRLEGVPVEKRTARFVCAVAAASADGTEFVVRGTIEGKIGYEERGEHGFGYDPIFYLPDMSGTTAELPPEEKNKISHRGRALEIMKQKLVEEYL